MSYYWLEHQRAAAFGVWVTASLSLSAAVDALAHDPDFIRDIAHDNKILFYEIGLFITSPKHRHPILKLSPNPATLPGVGGSMLSVTDCKPIGGIIFKSVTSRGWDHGGC